MNWSDAFSSCQLSQAVKFWHRRCFSSCHTPRGQICGTGPTEVANYHGDFVRVASLEAGNDVSAVFVVETAISQLFLQMFTAHRRSQTILMYYNLLQTMTNYSHLLVMINETQLWFQHIPLHCGWFCWMYGHQFSGFWHERFDHCLLVLWYTFFE